jgi:hypothetical protein
MKKNRMKKLALSRETLRALDEGKLVRVFGASDGSGGVQCLHSQCLNCQNTEICNTYTTCGTRAC